MGWQKAQRFKPASAFAARALQGQDARLLQPRARRILAARTPEDGVQGGEDAMRYDVIIIGAGSAGSVLAAHLPGSLRTALPELPLPHGAL
jgi:hypothetical protein